MNVLAVSGKSYVRTTKADMLWEMLHFFKPLPLAEIIAGMTKKLIKSIQNFIFLLI